MFMWLAVVLGGCGQSHLRGEPESDAPTFADAGMPIDERAPESVDEPSDPEQSLPAAVSATSRRFCPAHATTYLYLAVNLGADNPVPLAWDPADPAGTSNFSTGATVFDRRGISHALTIYFRKQDASSWEYHAMLDALANPGVDLANGTLAFDTDGALVDVTTGLELGLPASDGEVPSTIRFDFGRSIASGGDGLDGATQHDAPSNISALEQDGRAGMLGTACADDLR